MGSILSGVGNALTGAVKDVTSLPGQLLGGPTGSPLTSAAGLGSIAGIAGPTLANSQYTQAVGAANNRLQPYQQTGLTANTMLNNLLTNPSSLSSLPGYQFTKNQGLDAIYNMGTTTGLGTNTLFNAGKLASGFANQTYGDQFNRLLQGSMFGADVANHQANNTINAGQYTGSSYNNMANNLANSGYMANGLNLPGFSNGNAGGSIYGNKGQNGQSNGQIGQIAGANSPFSGATNIGGGNFLQGAGGFNALTGTLPQGATDLGSSMPWLTNASTDLSSSMPWLSSAGGTDALASGATDAAASSGFADAITSMLPDLLAFL